MVNLPPKQPVQYAIWKIIVGGILITFGLGGLTFRLQLDSVLREQERKQHHPLNSDLVSFMHTFGTIALYCGLVMVPLGLILILTAKKKNKPQA
jgi:hypothetical protein